MVENGYLTDDQLTQVLQYQRSVSCRFGEAVIAKGYADELAVLDCLAQQFMLNTTDVEGIHPDPAALKIIPYSLAISRQILPVEVDADTLTCVISDPLDVVTTDEVQLIANRRLRLVLAQPTALRHAIQRSYGFAGVRPKTATTAKLKLKKLDTQQDRKALIRAISQGGTDQCA